MLLLQTHNMEVCPLPINIQDSSLPAVRILESENIFVMTAHRAMHQDIRPLRIAILNLMPKKVETETQLLRLLGNTPLQVDVELLQTASHVSKNTSQEHLLKYYNTFADVRDQRFDGLIITGAPVENLEFEEVDYWNELCEIMDWARTNVYSTLYICWGAQAGLYHRYGIPKHALPQKMFGVFEHEVLVPTHPLLRGYNDVYPCPHSRHTGIDCADVEAVPELELLACSDIAGPAIIANRNGREFFLTGHVEYDAGTLASEYFRDLDKGLPIQIPYHYFPGDDPSRKPLQTWRAHANLLFSNWLNYFVYQMTPYDLTSL